ncbi:iron-containing redox enzyme family protein [Frankia sp. AgKG'84/4]|uniref:iron-containing redox enzyme family protein n=1 Tax=Frankia sp. AgKG'84/4 TaxID=573490 RepID=UPI00200EEC04|nr:iron-containing redox enzyme family protein [Frankia sp. AgKG'84/4]MCL9794408.1 iron-containing redox enzyme family protein [Frankia sp. AgKG'84/4]
MTEVSREAREARPTWASFDHVEAGVRRRVSVDDPSIKTYLDDLLVRIADHRAVEHPFLNRYRTTTLTPEQERHLYAECYYFFRHLPFYITGMAMKTRDETILRAIVLNAADEVTSEQTHSALFEEFLASLGIDMEFIRGYQPLDVTVELNERIRHLYTEGSIEKSLGALYADETMSSIMVSKINDGLQNQGYDARTRHFWTIHIDVEVGHSNSVFNASAPYVHSADTRREFEAGTFDFLAHVERYWDGVQKLVGL